MEMKTRLASFEGGWPFGFSDLVVVMTVVLSVVMLSKSRGSGDESDKSCGLETHFRYVEREKELMKKNKS
jgi:hypothetical protein